MVDSGEPFVSVVTPFYNTADYLAECIESVLGQSHRNFEYVLLNNCSTDGSREIAAQYAKTDSRIRLHDNARFLSQVANYNAALELISPESCFTKIVQADDKIFPNCLGEMVRVADSNPKVGIVSSMAMRGTKPILEGFPFAEEVVSGRAVCREQLLNHTCFFASPTTVLYRSDIVRSRRPFYDERLLHEDTENCYEVLLDWDFGFVKQVLSYLRTDNDSMLVRIREFDPRWPLLDKLIITRRFGQRFLTTDEYEKCWNEIELNYIRYLGDRYFLARDPRFWARHRAGMASISYQPNRLKLVLYGIRSLAPDDISPRRFARYCKKVMLKVTHRVGLTK